MQQNLAQVLQDMGRDIAVPGVELAINLLQELLADLKGKRAVNVIDVEEVVPAKRLGRPPGKKRASGWPEGREARSREMARRKAVAKAKREGGTVKIKGMHPRDPKHPGHAAWLEKIKTAHNKFWNSLTPAQQQARNRKMVKARLANQTARAAVDGMKVAS